MSEDKMLGTVVRVLASRGARGWLVGGSVRDRQLGRYSPDLDLVVDGDAASVAIHIAGALHLPWFALSERHGTFRVVGGEGHVDVATMREGSILADLALRDFTINAMAVPVGGGDLVDPFGGSADLRSGRLVAVSDHIFASDPLRLMRAPRFCHGLGLTLDSRLMDTIQAQASELVRAAAERVTAEMVITLGAGRAGDAVRLWDRLGLLQALLPELVQTDDVDRVGEVLDGLEAILADLGGWFLGAEGALERRMAVGVDGTVERAVALRLAGLLSGLTGRQAGTAGRRLKLSRAMVSLLETAAKMGLADKIAPPLPAAPRSRAAGRVGLDGATGLDSVAAPGRAAHPGREAVAFLWEAAPWEPEVLLLTAAEAAAARAGAPAAPAGAAVPEAADGTTAEALSAVARLEGARWMMSVWAKRARYGIPALPVDGSRMMKELDLSPGPRLGRALRAARLAWESGEATSAEDALAAARQALGGEQ
jgi:Poly A polymerase head domain/Probable RNA and SrmB- binding site of polymerase A